ncbi:MAG TPA: spermidine synthase [Candidatus Hydrothermia bacterium]|nr:spermidine synthase [Candidatus Hydrothermia bacterium]
MTKPKITILTEEFSPGVKISYHIERVLCEESSPFQKILVGEVEGIGKSMFLNNTIQSAEIDEHIYHEVLVHPACLFHPNPKSVLIFGGGEGATLREVLKYPVKRVVLVEIDAKVIDVSKKFLPEWSKGSFEDPSVELIFDDVRLFVEKCNEKFDIIISDLTDPFTDPNSIESYSTDFFRLCNNIMGDGAILQVQSGSMDPFFIKNYTLVKNNLTGVFKYVAPYGLYIFSFFSVWGFHLASNVDYFSKGQKVEASCGYDFTFYKPELFETMVKIAQIYKN